MPATVAKVSVYGLCYLRYSNRSPKQENHRCVPAFLCTEEHAMYEATN